MSKLSLHAVDQMYRSSSEDPVLMLLHLTFPDASEYFYVNNREDIISNGQTYTAFPFDFVLPDDNPDSEPELNITISNVGLELIDSFRGNTQDITAEINMVFASFPDFSEISITDLVVRNISYDARAINITLAYEDILNTTIPSSIYSPTDFPGLYSV